MRSVTWAGDLGAAGLPCLGLFEFLCADVAAEGRLQEFFALPATGMWLLLAAGATLAVGWGWRDRQNHAAQDSE